MGSSSVFPRNTVTQSASFISGVLDHTDDDPLGNIGNMMSINANPEKQGEDLETYYLYTTEVFNLPSRHYRISFWGANLLKFATSGRDDHIGLSV